MKVWMFVAASLTAIGLTASTLQAQVMQLGRMGTDGKVARASCDCSGGGLLGKWGAGGGCASCGVAGNFLHEGDAGPDYGYGGLGYAGGFGSCGSGDCGSCGVGGYFGRNLHHVNPCACGGSLLGDLARGAISVVDRTVGCVVGGVFGGLKTVTCHASGSFAALQCAAQASCRSCNGGGCDMCAMDPGCGVAGYHDGEIYSQPMPAGRPQELMPVEPQPMESADPFIDDPPAPTPQAQQQYYPGVRRASYEQPPRARANTSLQQPYFKVRGRPVTLRR